VLKENVSVLAREEEAFLLWTREEKRFYFIVHRERRLRWNIQARRSSLDN